MSLTICYITARREPKIEWFFDSLANQADRYNPPENIVVDRFAKEEGRVEWLMERVLKRWNQRRLNPIMHVAPKPNVWNGAHRLTSQDWFAMASARNTAICLCETSHIAFVDDLSVLMHGWLDAAYEAVDGGYIGLGAYKKVLELEVVDGVPVHFVATERGTDDRLRRVSEDVASCKGGWLYGCSFVAPLEDLLEVGGFPEFCDGLSSEDYCLGIALANAGKHLKYCRKMMTLESEELHFVEPAMKRTDKGVSPEDKSHAALRIAMQSKYFPNYYEGGIRALRDHVLVGNPFPVVQIPTHDWFDAQPISEM